MKRFNYLLFLLVGVLVMVSCGKDKKNEPNRCWEVTVYINDVASLTTYVWGTEEEARQANNQSVTTAGMTSRLEVKQADINDEQSCKNSNISSSSSSSSKEYCWKITTTVAGSTNVHYFWGTESAANMQVAASKLIGTGIYEKADAADEDACYSLEHN